jgi:hypothetical protein
MIMRIRQLLAVAALVSTAGCYKYTVVSGAPESEKKIQNNWQKSWVIGLVPPDTIRSKTECPKGIAKFETQHSFLNGLVAAITYNIFTPIQPTITCAQ